MPLTPLDQLMTDAPILVAIAFSTSIVFSVLTYKGLTAENPMELPQRLYGSANVFQVLVALLLAIPLGVENGFALVLYSSIPPFVVFYGHYGYHKAVGVKESINQKQEQFKRIQEQN